MNSTHRASRRDWRRLLLRRLPLLLPLILAASVYAQECPIVGAIRWDAWHGEPMAGTAVEKTLSPPEFQHRAPFCSQVVAPDRLEIDCTAQETMDREVRLANTAGLDFWAFLAYPQSARMSIALERYRQSLWRSSLLRFSVILTPQSLRQPPGTLSANLDRFAGYAAEDGYQKVLGNRPLVFFLPQGGFVHTVEGKDWLRRTMTDFRARVTARGAGEPYLVLMDWNAERGQRLVAELGFDALSAYALQGDEKAAPYGALRAVAKGYWTRALAAGAKLVPTAMTGWDRRPRVLNPVPWETQVPRADEIEHYYEAPKPEQLAEHVAETMHWVKEHRRTAEANAVLVYAWNEHDEGGWLAPTLGEGDQRVRALGETIRKLCPARQ